MSNKTIKMYPRDSPYVVGTEAYINSPYGHAVISDDDTDMDVHRELEYRYKLLDDQGFTYVGCDIRHYREISMYHIETPPLSRTEISRRDGRLNVADDYRRIVLSDTLKTESYYDSEWTENMMEKQKVRYVLKRLGLPWVGPVPSNMSEEFKDSVTLKELVESHFCVSEITSIVIKQDHIELWRGDHSKLFINKFTTFISLLNTYLPPDDMGKISAYEQQELELEKLFANKYNLSYEYIIRMASQVYSSRIGLSCESTEMFRRGHRSLTMYVNDTFSSVVSDRMKWSLFLSEFVSDENLSANCRRHDFSGLYERFNIEVNRAYATMFILTIGQIYGMDEDIYNVYRFLDAIKFDLRVPVISATTVGVIRGVLDDESDCRPSSHVMFDLKRSTLQFVSVKGDETFVDIPPVIDSLEYLKPLISIRPDMVGPYVHILTGLCATRKGSVIQKVYLDLLKDELQERSVPYEEVVDACDALLKYINRHDPEDVPSVIPEWGESVSDDEESYDCLDEVFVDDDENQVKEVVDGDDTSIYVQKLNHEGASQLDTMFRLDLRYKENMRLGIIKHPQIIARMVTRVTHRSKEVVKFRKMWRYVLTVKVKGKHRAYSADFPRSHLVLAKMVLIAGLLSDIT